MRTPRKASRRRPLAAPIVVTTLIGAGCSGRTYDNPMQPQIAPADPTTEPTSEPTTVPDAPATAAASVTPATDLASLPDPPVGAKGALSKNDDGSCTFTFHDDCPPGASCNPGPPLRVKCAPSPPLPDPPKNGKGRVTKRDDGPCWYHASTECPPGARCNPGPPRQVKCTDAAGAD